MTQAELGRAGGPPNGLVVPAPAEATLAEEVVAEEIAFEEALLPQQAPATGGPAEAGTVHDPKSPEAAEEVAESEATDEPAEPEAAQEEPEVDPAEASRLRFEELVEERVRRLRYSHGLTRTVFTPEEQLIRNVVDRRAAVWVPTFTFIATIGSAVAAVALATRLRSDPAQEEGTQFFIVLGAVVLLAASFVALFRSELYFDRLRPRGRTVRCDVADAYDAIRDAPRLFVELGAGADVLTRVSDLQPVAEKLVDTLVEYAAAGGAMVRAHPAYERMIRMRAEVEVLALLLEEAEDQPEGARKLPRDPAAPLPRPDQVADYESLGDIAAFIEHPDD